VLGRNDRRREAGFHSPKILIGNKFHPSLGFPGILSACPSYPPTQPAAIVETNTGKDITRMQFMPAQEAKAVHAQLERLGLLLPRPIGIFRANENRDAGAHASSAAQSSIEVRGPQEDIKQLSPLQIIENFRGASDIRRFPHTLFQEAAGQFPVLGVELWLLNLPGDELQMPVSPCQEVRAAHFTLIERSHGGLGTRFGCAFERHVVLPAEKCSEPASRPIVQQRNLDQNGSKVWLLE
jgi:hypothetical protein